MTPREPNESYERFSSRLKELFDDRRDINQSDLARVLNCSRSNISMYLNMMSLPTNERLIKMSKFFQVNPAWLMGADVNKYEESHSRYNTSDTITRQTLKDEERILLSHFGELDEEEQKFFLKQMERAARERGETDDY